MVALAMDGDDDGVDDALAPEIATSTSLTDAEGAGEHCHEGAMLRFHQVAFDWLGSVMPQAEA